MPILTAVREACIALARAPHEPWTTREDGTPRTMAEREDALSRTTEFADVAAAEAHVEALELTLRAPDGSIVLTESIEVRDNEFTLSLATEDDVTVPDPLFADSEADKQLLADMEHDAALLEEWFGPDWDCEDDRFWEDEPAFPRYQIHVELSPDTSTADPSLRSG
jgi:hypothetical protein